MKPRSAKAKGRRLQDTVREILRERFKDKLEDDDITTAIMGESGIDVKLSPAARKIFPYSAECKNQEKLNIWAALKQAEGHTKPILIFKRNHSDTYVAMRFEDFLNLLNDDS